MPPYEERDYRRHVRTDLVSFEVRVEETDLWLAAESDLTPPAEEAVRRYRAHIADYISDHPDFRTSLRPLPVDNDAPEIVRVMAQAGEAAGVGPMAAVAGAIAEFVGRELQPLSAQVIVENGGDIYLATREARTIGIYAGASPLSGRVGLTIAADRMPLGVCTSSGRVGPSLSLGFADAVTAVAPSTPLADAAATALGNLVKRPEDIESALVAAAAIPGLTGAVIIIGDRLGAWGNLELTRL
jgi:ApbE superfamily uncharacterized protein (UPF0280 family)